MYLIMRTPEFIQNSAHYALRLAALGAAVFAAAHASPAVASEERGPAPQEVNEHGGHNQPLPPLAERTIRRDTAYLGSLGCSGQLLRNRLDTVVAVVTAEHCSLNGQQNQWIAGTDGKTYIIQPKPVVAKTGAKYSTLGKAAVIDQYVVPGALDEHHDIALGVAKGHTPGEAIKIYQKEYMTPQELAEQRVGQEAYVGGWPQYQPKPQASSFERQSFAIKLAGYGRATTPQKESLKTLWATASSTNDGAPTSYGISGGVGFTIVHGKIRRIGPASIFRDMKGDVPVDGKTPPSAGNVPSLKGQNVSTILGFSYSLLTPKNGGQILHAVRSEADIPGFISPEKAKQLALQELQDPAKPKTGLRGFMRMGLKGGGGDPTFVEDPLIVRRAGDKFSVIAWASKDEPGNFGLRYVSDSDLKNYAVFPNADGKPPTLIVLPGQLPPYQSSDPANPDAPGFFSGPDNLQVGLPADNIGFNQPSYTIFRGTDGNLTIAPAMK
jgi:hypothetical protein